MTHSSSGDSETKFDRPGTRPYSIGSFEQKVACFEKLLDSVTYRNVPLSLDARRTLMAEKTKFETFSEAVVELFGNDVSLASIKRIFTRISSNPDAEVDWIEVFGNSSEHDRNELDSNATGQTTIIAAGHKRKFGDAAGMKRRRDIAIDMKIAPTIDAYVAGSQKSVLSIWSASKLELQHSTQIENCAWVTGVDYLPNTKRVVAVTERSIVVWDPRTKAKGQDKYFITPLEASPQCLVALPVGAAPAELLSVAAGAEDTVLFGDDAGNLNVLTITLKDLSSKAGHGVTDSKDKFEPVFDLDPSSLTHPIIKYPLFDDWTTCIRYFPELDCFGACSPSSIRSTTLINLGKLIANEPIRYAAVPKGVNCFTYCHSLNVFITGGVDKIIRLWHPHLWQRPTAKLTGHLFTITEVCVNENEQHLISLSTARVFRVWDIHSYMCLQVFTENDEHLGEKRIYSMVFDNRHEQLITGSSVLQVWPLQRTIQEATQVPLSHEKPLRMLTVSPSGDRLVSICFDSTIKLWDLSFRCKCISVASEPHLAQWEDETSNGKETVVYKSMDVVALVADSTGKYFATGAEDGSVKVWTMQGGQLALLLPGQPGNLVVTSGPGALHGDARHSSHLVREPTRDMLQALLRPLASIGSEMAVISRSLTSQSFQADFVYDRPFAVLSLSFCSSTATESFNLLAVLNCAQIWQLAPSAYDTKELTIMRKLLWVLDPTDQSLHLNAISPSIDSNVPENAKNGETLRTHGSNNGSRGNVFTKSTVHSPSQLVDGLGRAQVTSIYERDSIGSAATRLSNASIDEEPFDVPMQLSLSQCWNAEQHFRTALNTYQLRGLSETSLNPSDNNLLNEIGFIGESDTLGAESEDEWERKKLSQHLENVRQSLLQTMCVSVIANADDSSMLVSSTSLDDEVVSRCTTLMLDHGADERSLAKEPTNLGDVGRRATAGVSRQLAVTACRLTRLYEQVLDDSEAATDEVWFRVFPVYLISAHADGFIRFWRLQHSQSELKGNYMGRVKPETRSTAAPLTALELSTDGFTLFAADSKGYISVWNITKLLRSHVGGDPEFESSKSRPLGGKATNAVGSDDDGDSRALVEQELSWRAHGERIDALAYLGDCDLLFSGSADLSVRIWSPARGRYFGFLGQLRDISLVTIVKVLKGTANPNDGSVAILNKMTSPSDIYETPLIPMKRKSTQEKLKQKLSQMQNVQYPLIYDQEKWEPMRASARKRVDDATKTAGTFQSRTSNKQQTTSKFFGALARPRLNRDHLDSIDENLVNAMDGECGISVFSSLPVYRVNTPHSLEHPRLRYTADSKSSSSYNS